MSARATRVTRTRRSGRRNAVTASLTAALTAAATTSLVALGMAPAHAATTWYVATNGTGTTACAGTATQPCSTVSLVVAKAAFAAGDTINVAPGVYTDHPGLTTKGANIVGTGDGVIFDGGGTTWAIAVNSGANPAQTVSLTNLTLRNGGYGLGGALPVYTGTVNLTDVTVAGSKSYEGGGVYVASGANLNVTGGAFTNNSATAPNSSYPGWGGAIYAYGNTTVAIDGTRFTNNSAAGGGYANGGIGGAVLTNGSTTIKNATFKDNLANGSGGGGLSGYGGSVYAGGPTLTISDTTIDGGSTSPNATIGGGLAAAGKVSATDLTVTGNSALVAGGVYLTSADATFTDSMISDNHATNASIGAGGGLDVVGPATGSTPLVLDNTAVTGNSAGLGGGGLAIGARVAATVRNGSAIEDNTAVYGAGALNAGSLTVTASSVTGNDSSYIGGGIYNGSSNAADSPALTLTDSHVDGNTAALSAGGLATLVHASASVSGGTISGNSAYGGGGIAVGDGAAISVDGATLNDNTATGTGGGGLLNAGTSEITRSTLSNNHATYTSGLTGLGGAIWSGSSTANATSKLTVKGSTLSGNDGYAGAAVLTYSTGSGATNTASIDNSTIAGNTDSSAVGALEFVHPASVTNSTLTDNAAAGGAGALYGTATVVAGSIFSGNGTKTCAGTITDGGYNLVDAAGTSCGFTPAKHDITAAADLAALADNGGTTQTRKPGPLSPALDAVPAGTATGQSDAVTGSPITLCAAGSADQRGTDRPQGSHCDIGSVEVVQVAPVVSGPASADYSVGDAGAPVTFTATGSPAASFTASGDVPAGISLHDNGDGTATLSGTPAANTGGDHTITIKATNEAGSDSMTFVLDVHQAPALAGPDADTFTVGEQGGPDVFTMTSGHPTASLSKNGALPDGVHFADHGDGSATIEGTPAAGSGGVYPITIKASNGTGPDATAPFTLTVNEAPSIDGPASSTFTVGTTGASTDFTAAGYPVATLTATGLPDGLQLTGSGDTVKITGTPTAGTGGEYDVTITATNGVGDDATMTTHVVVREKPGITGPTSARFVSGSAGSIAFATTGYPQAQLSVSGDVPAGLTFHDNGNGTATLSGTATTGAVGEHQITVTASNGIAPDAVQQVTIEVVPQLAISTTSLPDAAHGAVYGSFVKAVGGMPPYDFTITSGSLPAGLALGSDGQITGTPTGAPGTSTFTVKVTDSDNPAQSQTRSLSITVTKGDTALAVTPVVLKLGPSLLDLGLDVGVVKATLTGGAPSQPIAGQTVVFKAGNATVCTAVTTASGLARCTLTVVGILQVTLGGGVSASYAGSAAWKPSAGSAGLIG